MRYGLDGRTIQDHFPGVGRYAHALARWLPDIAPNDSFMLFVDPLAANSRYDLDALASKPNLTVVPVSARVFGLRQQWRLWDMARRHRLDLYHSPYYVMPYAMPCPVAVTIHDLIPHLYPDALPSDRPVGLYRLLVRFAARRADAILVDSTATRTDLVKHGLATAERVTAVPLGVAREFGPRPAQVCAAAARAYGLEGPYVLYMGINKPHKNLGRLIAAWALLPVSLRHTHCLVIAGPKDTRHTGLQKAIEAHGVSASVRLIGRVREEDMAPLYGGATAFVFPSLYEGFGLPVLEAMACGTPVACSSTPSVAEVAGDAGILFDPLDVAGIRDALSRLLADAELRSRLREAGLGRAAEFSWERTARRTLEVLRRTITEARRT